MLNLREGDSPMVGHARRELEMAKLFDADEKEGYDGFIGRGALSLVKSFNQWTDNDPAKMEALSEVFLSLIHKDLLSAPTNDPEEWEEFNIEGSTGLKNKRNEMYISRDNLETWYNLRSGQQGVLIDHKTGKPLEGVKINDGKRTTDGGNGKGDGASAEVSTAQPEEEAGKVNTERVEDSKLNDRVEPESQEDSNEPETATPESEDGKE